MKGREGVRERGRGESVSQRGRVEQERTSEQRVCVWHGGKASIAHVEGV
jgi:hypothetical protein